MMKMKTLQPKLSKNLKILFVGANPHPKSVERGGYFTNRTDFWRQLHEAKLTEKEIRDDELLLCGYGIIDVVERPTASAREITSEEWEEGVKKLKAIIEEHKPKIVSFIGKKAYGKFFGVKTSEIKHGLQPDRKIGESMVFIMIFPTIDPQLHKDRIQVLRDLKNLKDKVAP